MYIPFKTSLAKQKPNTLMSNSVCPFCDFKKLREEGGILTHNSNMLHIANKFPTFENARQTLIIENPSCEEDLSNYSKEHLYSLMRFTLEKWKEMRDSKEFKCVTLFKNHGFLSGASIHHAHMQIVGFYDLDYQSHILQSDFEGLLIQQKNSVSLNLSTNPRSEFYEFNISMKNEEDLPIFADYLQNIIHHTLHHLNIKHKSFNLVFYEYEHSIIVKVIPRYPTSSYLLGYNFRQLPTNLKETVLDIQNTYFPLE